MREIVVDNFAGGGGASEGCGEALGRSVDIAINHDPAAIAMHKVNHPDTEHYCESVWDIDPVKAVRGRPVALCWFSPDCKHFSKAKGGKPVEKNIRGLAWVAIRWASKVKPRVIILENVEEFKTWGPLTKDNYPDPARKGETFNQFIGALKTLGYKVDWRELKACDYGAPTIRKRFFLIARRDGHPIKWPEPTHGNPKGLEVAAGLLKPWRTAAEIIDWNIPCPSIFSRKKPLVENTMRRVAMGTDKFVINAPEPFILSLGHTGFTVDRTRSMHEPLNTLVSKAEACLVSPTLIQYHTETTKASVRGQKIDEPIMTLDSSPRYGLVNAFISKYYGGFYEGAGSDLKDPIATVTSKDHHALVTAHMIQMNNNMIGAEVNQPVNTIVAGAGHIGEVATFLTKYYGQGIGQKCNVPMDTVVSKDRFGVITVKITKVSDIDKLGHWVEIRDMLNKYCNYNIADDEVLLLCFDGIYYFISDMGLRMLEPRELFNAQGFPADYIIDHDIDNKPYPKTAQVARCGNAVPPPFAKALVRANLPELCDDSKARQAV